MVLIPLKHWISSSPVTHIALPSSVSPGYDTRSYPRRAPCHKRSDGPAVDDSPFPVERPVDELLKHTPRGCGYTCVLLGERFHTWAFTRHVALGADGDKPVVASCRRVASWACRAPPQKTCGTPTILPWPRPLLPVQTLQTRTGVPKTS